MSHTPPQQPPGTAPSAPEASTAATVSQLRQRLGHTPPPVAVLLGTGWGPLAQQLQGAAAVPYAELPAFPTLAVGGHAGLLQRGVLHTAGHSREVLVLAGRKHAYETGRVDGMAGVIQSLAAWGVQVLVQTNAAGSLRPHMPPGALMLLEDHINLVQASPLFGLRGDDRFVDMSAAYCPALRAQALALAAGGGTTLHRGVYAWLMGPQFETPAEIRMLQTLGADAVGMSTVPETILARHAGLRVLGLSLMTNMAAGLSAEHLSHAHTMATASAAAEAAVALLARVVVGLQV
jgi:purine-nucleoside phosphorylase